MSSDNIPLSSMIQALEAVDDRVIGPLLSDDLRSTTASARAYADTAHSTNTKRAYRADLADFDGWCSERGISSMPADPAALGLYLASLADRRASFATIRRRIAAINGAHRDRGLDSPSAHPEVRRIVAGIARTIGTAQSRKDAMTLELLREAVNTLDGSVIGARDRAILLFGFAGAFRRSELAALDVADLKFSRRGLLVTLRRSKTDQTGEGRDVAIPSSPIASLCAVRAIKAWMQVAHIESGPLFRKVEASVAIDGRISDKSIARLIKRVATNAGLAGDFSGHSLRAGFVTSAAEKRVHDRDIARVTGHRSMQVLGGYVRRAQIFDAPALLEIMK